MGEQSGLFLTAMACAEDSHWPEASKAKQIASKLRRELGGVLGGAQSVATLLAVMAQDGRLHPGLSLPVTGPIVSSEVRSSSSRAGGYIGLSLLVSACGS